jgi:hypothetical protein
MKDPVVAADQAAQVAAVAAMAPIVAGVVAAEMTVMITTPMVRLGQDRAKWGMTSAASSARRGTGPVTAGPSQRRRWHTLRKENP